MSNRKIGLGEGLGCGCKDFCWKRLERLLIAHPSNLFNLICQSCRNTLQLAQEELQVEGRKKRIRQDIQDQIATFQSTQIDVLHPLQKRNALHLCISRFIQLEIDLKELILVVKIYLEKKRGQQEGLNSMPEKGLLLLNVESYRIYQN